MKTTIGGDRLGAGKKMEVDLRTYNRSTHDLGYIWRSAMSAGTLVPFLKQVALPGDTWDIELDTSVLTHPTIGPLFGSYKVQLDVYQVPMRLYQGDLHNNALGIGMKMNTIKLPRLAISLRNPAANKAIDNSQINPSSILKYLGISGNRIQGSTAPRTRYYNAVPYLAYWDIYKNYYANKQEEIGAMLHLEGPVVYKTITGVTIKRLGTAAESLPRAGNAGSPIMVAGLNNTFEVSYTGAERTDPSGIIVLTDQGNIPLSELITGEDTTVGTPVIYKLKPDRITLIQWDYVGEGISTQSVPKVQTFPLENIDTIKTEILRQTGVTSPYTLTSESILPYSAPLKRTNAVPSALYSQEGLALKTYQSDLFNNWISTEWIDGTDGINEITAIDTSDGSFTIDTLILSRKVYDMLNRIAISGGTYDDWLNAVYTHERKRGTESPVYMGGLIKELVFQEVVSNSASETEEGGQPLGTLAGKGVLSKKHKGGKVTIKIDEPSYVMGIVSLTPRIDYSQGNDWDVNLQTIDDLHKPALDEIGFQDLITDQMHSYSTGIDTSNLPVFKSAGKQPAWLNYMTNVNKTYSSFAEETNQMFMTLNRRYETDYDGNIKDLTTYIDPAKFNFIFAETARDAQNFWVQIGLDMTVRRKMSAKIMPNL